MLHNIQCYFLKRFAPELHLLSVCLSVWGFLWVLRFPSTVQKNMLTAVCYAKYTVFLHQRWNVPVSGHKKCWSTNVSKHSSFGTVFTFLHHDLLFSIM